MSQEECCRLCEKIFADHLGGHELMTNAGHIRGSAWINFPRIICRKWSHGNIILLGDAAHTAHFSIGSGTKLALEDRSEEHTYELQSLMRISYAVFCLQKKKQNN